MYRDSIVDLFGDCCRNFEKEQENFLKDPKKLPEFAMNMKDHCIDLGIRYIEETLEYCDQTLRDSSLRRAKGWHIVRKDYKSLVTSIGEVKFHKTLFRNVKTGASCYLLDQIMGIGPNERLTEDAEACLLEEAVQTSYRKGGEEASLQGSVSKETVMNKIHSLVFESEKSKEPEKEKRIVDYLFIDADEDHVPLQFHTARGDLTRGENGYKINTEIAKLVYVYEGIEKESPRGGRNRLINPHYFSGVYKGKKNNDLWDEVYAYMDRVYDLSKVKKIYLGADGGAWIKGCPARIAGITYALDEFHLQKYLNQMTAHLYDSAEDARQELLDVIRDGSREQFRRKAENLLGYTEDEARRNRIRAAADYVLENWTPAKVRLSDRKTLRGCSAEGHVSHVLSSRMSSRPMGWSSLGVDRMAHLRAYYFNGGSMLALVKKQPRILEGLKMAAGAEEIVASAGDILASEHKGPAYGRYVDVIQASITDEVAKWGWFNGHIWGL